MDFDTFLTLLYVLIDDWYQQNIQPNKPKQRGGARERMSDSEILTLAIAGQWRSGVPWDSERSLVRYMRAHGRRWFPHMLERSAFNQRVRKLCNVLADLQQEVCRWLGDETGYEIVDGLPLPTASLGQVAREKHHWLMEADTGHGGNNGGWFFGQRWLVSITSSGAITGWVVAQASINERWLLEALLSQRAGDGQLHLPPVNPRTSKKDRPTIPTGFIGGQFAVGKWGKTYLADRGFNGETWCQHWKTSYDATVITVPPQNAPTHRFWTKDRCHSFASLRQAIETTYAIMTTVFDIKHLNAHSQWGQYTRLAAKAAAYNLGLFLNRLFHRPQGALKTLIS